MAVKENNTSVLPFIGTLFYISKVFGIISLSFTDFFHKKKFKLSKIGVMWVLIALVLYVGAYHVLVRDILSSGDGDHSTLTQVIGYFLMYLAPMMMIVDNLIGIYNRKNIIGLFDRFRFLDERLLKENIIIDNKKLRQQLHIVLAVAVCGELAVASLTYSLFSDQISGLYFIVKIPILLNTIEKIWFASLLFAIRQRFEGINSHLDGLVELELKKKKLKDVSDEKSKLNWGYLHREILMKNPAVKRTNKVLSVVPWNDTAPVKINADDLRVKSINRIKDDYFDIMKMEVKLNTIAQMHDEICEIGKDVNSMWSIQMLLLMAYGFMSITAQFYFFYCALATQTVPVFFLSANSTLISLIFIVYTSAKCVYLIYLSWHAKIESKKTGVCLHRISLAVDENNFYEIINHLSLKLLNHGVNFNAYGFFSLDMSTLYAVTGAITSYLIILIQFNLAADQTKSATTESALQTVT